MKMEFKIQQKSNYIGKIYRKKYDTTLEFYTNKQMKAIYPNKNYKVVGTMGSKTGIQSGSAENLDGKPLPIYKVNTHNKFTEAVVGYALVNDNFFIAVVKNVLLKMVVFFLIVMLIIGGGITVAMNYSNWFKSSVTDTNGKIADIDENAEDWKGALPYDAKGGTSSGIAIPGYKTIQLKADQKKQIVSFVNPKQNTCYFVISLSLPDGTKIYKSKMIPPSKGLYSIDLNEEVKSGTYIKSILKYECYNMDDNLTKLNGANVEVTLEVK